MRRLEAFVRTSLFLPFFSMALSTMPAWSAPAPDKKPSIDAPVVNAGQDGKKDNKKSASKLSKDDKNDEKKAGSSVKKKAVKSVGTAAAAGAVTKKVTNEIKK